MSRAASLYFKRRLFTDGHLDYYLFFLGILVGTLFILATKIIWAGLLLFLLIWLSSILLLDRKNYLILKAADGKTKLIVKNKGLIEEYDIKGSRFRWSYQFSKVRGGHSSTVVLNLELLTFDKKRILIYHPLSSWSNTPKGWKYFYERDALNAPKYPIDHTFKIWGGLKSLKNHVEETQQLLLKKPTE